MDEEYQNKLCELLKLCVDLNSDDFPVDYSFAGHKPSTVSVTVWKPGFKVGFSWTIELCREQDSDVDQVIDKLKARHWDHSLSTAHIENEDN